jgi:hypothetical protein
MRFSVVATLVPIALACLLTGCGLNSTSELSQPTAGAALRGNVHGGQQPVVGAHVYLFAANTTGYAGSGIAPSSNNASISLLNASSTGNSDSLGAYVLTDNDGSFSLTGDYTCTPGQQVYLYAQGGNTGTGSNPNAAFLAIVGNCPAAGNFASTVPFLWMNEVSTIAAAYAMAGYATDATHVSSANISVAKTGLANAFANAANLVGISTGTALTSTPAGNGTVPAYTINSLADILAACVNTSSTTSGSTVIPSTSCNTLLSTATSDSTSSGTMPSDTASAAINIAHFPAANVATLFGLIPPTVAFAPALSYQPNDLTLSIAFTGAGINSSGHLAIDATGNVWLSDNNRIAELSPAGVPLSPSTGYTDPNLTSGYTLAIDTSNNIWVDNLTNATLIEFNNSGAFIRTATLPYNAYHLAIDGSGNIWAPNFSGSAYNVSKLSSTGVSIGNYTGGGISNPSGIAITTSGNVWVSNSGSVPGLSEFSYTGTPVSSNPFNVAGITSSLYLAVDSSNNVWTMNNSGNVSAMNSSGTALTGSPFAVPATGSQLGLVIDGKSQVFGLNSSTNFDTGTTTFNLFALDHTGAALTGLSTLSAPYGANDLVIDNAGNLWISAGSTIVQVLGVATPVMTPLSASVQSGCLGKRPCFPPV